MEAYLQQKLETANKLIFVKQYTEAEKILRELTTQPPGKKTLLIHLRRVELAAKLGKLPQLREQYETMLPEPSSMDSYKVCMLLIDQHAEQLTPTEALEQYQAIMRDHGPSAAAYYGMGFTLEAMDNHDRAIYNYNQSLALDPDWYPSYFGLSQLYYNINDDKRGDQNFFQFENAAPYNVYGNFETHRRLSQEFLNAGKFVEAEAAIQSLSDWWFENKGHCPTEIQIYEALSTARIHQAQGDRIEYESRRNRARALAQQILSHQDQSENVLYFVARVFEEFDDFPFAVQFYRRILKVAGSSPQIVQKIGSQFLSMGELDLAKSLFDEAYETHPDNPDIRFCRLVTRLKIAKVNVEEYLIGKERLRQIIQNPGERVEVLALLHSLLAKFQEDPEVHMRLGEMYQRLGNNDRALRHFEKMHVLDPKSRSATIRYANFQMQNGDPEIAMNSIKSAFPNEEKASKDEQCEIGWLRSSYYLRKGDHIKSQAHLTQVLSIDPWNVSYLVQEAVNLVNIHGAQTKIEAINDTTLKKLAVADETDLNWAAFNQITNQFQSIHLYDLVYCRRKIQFLYASGADTGLELLTRAAIQHDPSRGTYDVIRLLNTNFDSFGIYLALGVLYKELWQLETATSWFEQALQFPGISAVEKAKAYLELADCYTWQGQQLSKAIEYAQLALDLGERKDERGMLVMSHALLKSGQVKQANGFLEGRDKDSGDSPESTYLRGLIEYRNGNRRSANAIWKPLLTLRSETRRFHHIKQEILKYYFDGAPYLKAH